MRHIKVSVIIPTYNAGLELENILKKIPLDYEKIIVDSSSTDDTVSIAKTFGCEIKVIPKREFNHGSTRNLAAQISTGNILVFLTQDAILFNEESIDNLIKPLIEDSSIGMSYGRQLPHKNAKIMGSFARLHNYPDRSVVKSLSDREELGIKTAFCSNSFAAYKREIFEELGMFPVDVILSEDTYVCAKMLLNNYKVSYVAEAMVYHSHDYSIIEEFKRYFDIGVFYGREDWILQNFSQAESEGKKFVVEQFKFLMKNKVPYLVFELILRNAMKYLGYKLGMKENRLSLSIKEKISMHKSYWLH